MLTLGRQGMSANLSLKTMLNEFWYVTISYWIDKRFNKKQMYFSEGKWKNGSERNIPENRRILWE